MAKSSIFRVREKSVVRKDLVVPLFFAKNNVKQTFRFASTAPWYVESSTLKNPVSRKSARFLLDWTRERIERVRKNVPQQVERHEVLKHHLQALDFWKKKVDEATRD